MATSGTETYNQTTNDIIEGAFQVLNIIMPGENVASDDYSVALKFLNRLVKSLQAQGLHLWTETECYIPLVSGTKSYRMNTTNSNKIGLAENSAYSTIATAASSTDTVLTLASVSGFSATQTVGVALDDDTIHWTTVASVDSANSTITLSVALTDDSAVGQGVFAYTTGSGRALEVSSARFVASDGTIRQLRPLSRKSYYMLPGQNTVTGTPIQYYVDKQRTYTDIKLYPTPDDTGERVQLTYKRILENFDDSDDDADFPDEWILPLIYNLALVIAPIYEVDSSPIQPIAVALTEGLRGYSQENNVRLRIRPDLEGV